MATIGEILQRDVEAAKTLFHNVEHRLEGGAREAFHEAHVLADSLEAKLVELGKATGATMHIEEAVNAIKPVLASLYAHVAAIVEPEVAKAESIIEPVLEKAAAFVEPAVAKVESVVESVVHAVEAEAAKLEAPAADPLPPAAPVADPVAEAAGPILVPITAHGADVTD